MDFKFELGITVEDTISGFRGVITRRTQWLNNCNTYGVQPRELDKNGNVRDCGNFDEPQLKMVAQKKAALPFWVLK